MLYAVIKVIITSIIVVIISEISKKAPMVGGVIASLPVISILAMIWLYVDTQKIESISTLSISTFWMVIPSLSLFISLPLLLKSNLNFFLSLFLSCLVMATFYLLMYAALKHFGIFYQK